MSASTCSACGDRTELVKSAINWCKNCNIPIFDEVCLLCGKKASRIASDLRPVFPEERLLVEIVLGTPCSFLKSSVWCTYNSQYFVDGKKIPFSLRQASNMDSGSIIRQLAEYSQKNTYTYFNTFIEKYVMANRGRFDYISSEAMDYIRSVAKNADLSDLFVSFSGGKDSTVVSDLVFRSLGTQQVLHIFGDTTLEFPETMEYVQRFKQEHPRTPVISSRNKNKEFYELAEQLGSPSRQMRWCCTVFKTGAIQRKIQSLFKNKQKILTFYGIRRSESVSRSKYDRESDSPKITVQRTISPIIDWLDFDVWLYLLSTHIDFNHAYRQGYNRVGCWMCPNNGIWSEFLSKIYMPEQYKKWHEFLLSFAVKLGKPDPEVYVNEGKWKARQGGDGVEYSKKSILSFEPCALQENTINFDLQKPISEALYELFKPFGRLNFDLGNERLGEVYVIGLDGNPALKLQGKIGSAVLKVGILSKSAGHCNSIKAVEDKIKCQITKYQMCMGCLACESVCRHGAISIATDRKGLISYKISDEKCVRCGECINHFNVGCYIRKVLCIKR